MVGTVGVGNKSPIHQNIPESRYLWPALTTIHQGLFEIGRVALRTVHEAVEGATGSGERHIVIQPKLIVRDSTSAALVTG